MIQTSADHITNLEKNLNKLIESIAEIKKIKPENNITKEQIEESENLEPKSNDNLWVKNDYESNASSNEIQLTSILQVLVLEQLEFIVWIEQTLI